MNQRCLMLSTISHSLSAVSSHAQTSQLRSIVQQAFHLPPNLQSLRSNTEEYTQSAKRSILATILKEKLWKIAQTRLFDKSASRKLRPLRLAEILGERPPENMLDDLSVDPEEYDDMQLFSDMDDEDVLGDHDILDDVDFCDSEEDIVLLN